MKLILKSFKDYTTDRRGDIGNVVRKAAMELGRQFYLSEAIPDSDVV